MDDRGPLVERPTRFDALGTTAALLDESGAVTDRYVYRAFRAAADHSGASDTPRAFVGQRLEEGAGAERAVDGGWPCPDDIKDVVWSQITSMQQTETRWPLLCDSLSSIRFPAN